MKISISGTSCTGKSTLLEAMLRRWPMYITPTMTYRDVIKEHKLSHSSVTNEETQLMILNWMLEEQDKYKKGQKVVYDRCPWDNLAYTLQGNMNNQISDSVTAATIDIVKASLKEIDIIFWLRHDPDIKIVDDGMRDTNLQFIKETDQIFADLYQQYAEHLETSPFYLMENCPAIIEVIGTSVDDRLNWIGEFIDEKGDLIETTQSILDPENADILEQLLKDQQDQLGKDIEFLDLTKQLNNFKL
jgi:predicted ATPase